MIEAILSEKKLTFGKKMTVKAVLAFCVVALAVALPQVAHVAVGAQSGIKWLPMYLPVLLGGCLLGAKWGALIGVMSPVASFLITSAFGNPMPAPARLPFMMCELVIFAVISGLFSKKISENALYSFLAVFSAEIVGRGVFLLSVLIFENFSSLKFSAVLSQVVTGIPGLVASLVIVPVIAVCVKKIAFGEKND